MVGGGLGERERRNEKAPVELGDEPWVMSAAIKIISERQNHQVLDKELSRLLSIFPNASPSVAAADLASQLKKTSPGKALERIILRYMEHGEPKAEPVPQEGPKLDPPQAIEKPMDVFARPNVHRVGTSNHGEWPGDFGPEDLPLYVKTNYNIWTFYTLANEFPRYPVLELKRVLHENNSQYSSSYKAISSDYTAALAAELRGHGRKPGRLQGYPKLRPIPRDPTPEPPCEPCSIFERELQSIQNASAEGAKLATKKLKIDTGPQCGTHMDACEGETCSDIDCGGCCSQCGTHMNACEGETSTNIECWWWCSDYRFEEMVQCAGGHLHCFTCLRRRVEESKFGGSQASNSLPCIETSGCEESIPWSEVKRALPPDVFAKYEQRQAEDAVVPQSI